MKILLEIAYVGTLYHGFQVQNNAPSVQKTLQTALETFFNKKLLLSGCSRTDSGVHAKQFFCTVEGDIADTFPIAKLPIAASRFLPDDIAILSAKKVEDSFHVRYDVVYKEYEYLILNRAEKDPFLASRAYHYPRALDLDKMNQAAALIVGKHDFASFMAAGSKIVDSVRTVKSCSVEKNGDLVTVRVSADGFLYNMVRIICGTLIAVSEGKIKAEDIPDVIDACDRKRAGMTLPPDGLYLAKVVYSC